MSAAAPKIEFWYEFASTYSYLAAMRVEAAAVAAGVAVEWKPFLLGPIFYGQGWDNSPFNIYPVKGRYMVRDMERLAAERGIAFALPKPFPQNSLLAARVAVVGAEEAWIAPFTRAVFKAEFADGGQIADKGTLSSILDGLRLDSQRILARVEQSEIKDRLKRQTAIAQELGIFGAPSFVCHNELFWGNDRLDQAIAWSKGTSVR
jgi:2-hydroxychromene-2-carboxylate isomerase